MFQATPHPKSPAKFTVAGLYAIVDTSVLGPRDLGDAVFAVLKGGANVIQYRDKSGDQARRGQQAELVKQLCRQFGRPLVINDDIALAKAIDADGVHLGKHDPSIVKARQVLGHNAIIGVSCYNELALAIEAEKNGADYVAFGSFFSSKTKPDAVNAPLTLLHEARQQLNVPITAIGGITADNAGSLIAAGADAVAVIRDIFDRSDIQAAASRYNPLFIDQ